MSEGANAAGCPGCTVAYAQGRQDAAQAVLDGAWTSIVDTRVVEMAAMAAQNDVIGWREQA